MALDLSAPWDHLEVGYDIPAKPGMTESEIQKPALIIDLDAFERNLLRMRQALERTGVRLRAHGKMHKSVDSGLPLVSGHSAIQYLKCSDEHGVLADPNARLQINERLRLIPGHCDPTCNLHDWYVGVREGIVECLWRIDARGKSF